MSIISLFHLDNWRKFTTISFSSNKEKFSTLGDVIRTQNSKGFIVVFTKAEDQQHGKIDLYKKHSTSILKSIIIGKVSLLDFADLKKNINEIENQTDIIRKEFEKPEFSKYSQQRLIYFPE